MKFLYKTGIFFYSVSAKIAALFNTKAKQFVTGRKSWTKNLASKIETNARYVWVHCASLGEFEQGRPLIEEIRKQFPEYRILLTFFSPSGYEIRKNYELADIIMYLPVDTRNNARKLIRLVQPEKVFFIKYEYWHFYIDELKKKNIPLYIVSAIFRKDQQFFKNSMWGRWYRQLLKKVEHFFVQNEESKKLLQSIGLNNSTVTGDTRFDRVAAIARGAKEIPIVEKFKGNNLLLIAGSTWKPDEELLAAFINKHPQLRVVIAPHEVTETNMNRLEQLLKTSHIRLSKAEEKEINNYQVLIIDSVGLLSSLYRYGNLAYIGGGFGVGIHNILEAATFGLPVMFGPNYKKFKEAVELKERGGAYPIKNFEQLKSVLGTFLETPAEMTEASTVCKNYVEENVGATNFIIKKVFNN
ncbi:3-deoxy-D-manno-octulosonic-acid transferase [Mariniphaga anaerophila]|uniref:3-deoxy-D-manno-octulosonic acid transferase n=1 Tax=Mariniphaga anaerophila TaxID=1484053 RepID=A0A1M5BGD3_9BACT|nr:glycosyltransferase N-terminal domain-containing protein [Mariniphaga anaerophila]SHF41623.1 3-deoxy-D-manno-octulosonic-acid transferase [Mariniphaga anaerophila]